ncbi:ATP-dependent DNA helicase [Roseivirga sp. BDSF3-8]|uniref:ATP-dependent DNA helicase n=1 Tax=Roseivirga sp. BDSF3-8 TaxID=3241598 RepID=UPI0035327471
MAEQEKYNNTVRTIDENLRIIACAGSGKTTFVAKRVSYLLESGYEPKNIIAFTYTERAAAELNNKIVAELKDKGIFDVLNGFADMFIGTIHGWCLKALMDNEIGYQKYSVLDDIKLRLFVDKNYKKIGMSNITKLNNPNVNMKIFTDTERFIQLMNIIRESDLTESLPPDIQEAKIQYETLLRDNSYFDFTMIMQEALERLRVDGSDLQTQLKRDLKFLIVDEFQDINPIQNDIIRHLHESTECNITVVGDDDQNIFHWRGSNNKFLKDFPNRYAKIRPVKLFTLDKNYRSSKGITGLASAFIEKNQKRIEKRMISAEKQEFIRDKDILYNEYSSPDEENEEIVKKIKALKGVAFEKDGEKRGIDYSDFCILLRTWKKSAEIVSILEKHSIPYITAGVNELFDTKEVIASAGIFQYLNDKKTYEQLTQLWLDIPDNHIDLQKLESAIKNLEKWKPDNFQKHRKSVGWGDFRIQEIFWEFLKDAEIVEETFITEGTNESITQSEIIFYNLGKFSQVINDYETIYLASAPPSFYLFNFLNFIKYAAVGYYPEGWMNNPYKTPNAVQLMTIHQSKGLEFPVVFIPGLNKNYFPIKKMGGLKVWHFLDPSLIKDHDRYEPEDDDRLEDERRLLYVAITRSQKFLFISRAPENNRLYREKSSFSNELVSDYISRPLKPVSFEDRDRLAPQQKSEDITISLNFSVLKDFFDCNYRFKLITMYGFCFPLNQRMGLGKSLHDTLMAIHKRLTEGKNIDNESIEYLAKNQSHFPYIGRSSELEKMKGDVVNKSIEYFKRNEEGLQNIEFVEQDIKLSLDENVFVSGRIDLIKTQSYEGEPETTIMEFKSNDSVQSDTITIDQLNLYALGYKELVGKNADYIQIYDVEKNAPEHRSPIEERLLLDTENKIKKAAKKIRSQDLPKVQNAEICRVCFQNRLCKARIDLNLQSKK